MQKLCDGKLACDVVVISAEFAGRFFGDRGVSWTLQQMEEASCRPRCRGLFHAPREVFLLGCNTLATKDPDRRTPQQYLEVLLRHGFARAAAERVVALRYGPLGPSFREAARRIFLGVPRIYGFESLAPSGEHGGKLLSAYFRKEGSYRSYLDEAGRTTVQNGELFAIFRDTELVQITGLSPSEPAAVDRRQICDLFDENRSFAQRLRIVASLLDRDDFLEFLPSIEVFIRRHPLDRLGWQERRIFTEIRNHARARDEVLEIVDHLEVSALKMEMANLAMHLHWITRERFRDIAIEGARRLLGETPSSEAVDIMCEISSHEDIGDEFALEDLPGWLFEHAEGVRMIDCLAPTGDQVTRRLVSCLESPDLSLRLWAAYAISRRLPVDDELLIEIAAHLVDPSAGLRERLRWILTEQQPVSGEVRRAVSAVDPRYAAVLRVRGPRAKPGPLRPVR